MKEESQTNVFYQMDLGDHELVKLDFKFIPKNLPQAKSRIGQSYSNLKQIIAT